MNSVVYERGVIRTRDKKIGKNEEIKNYCLGLSSEVGEFNGHMKHVLYHGWELDKENVVEELGDVMWYLTALANVMGISLDNLMRENLKKLKTRYPNGFNHQDSINRIENKIKGEQDEKEI